LAARAQDGDGWRRAAGEGLILFWVVERQKEEEEEEEKDKENRWRRRRRRKIGGGEGEEIEGKEGR